MKQRFLCRRAAFIAVTISLAIPLFPAHAQSPSSIGGRTIELTISSGTYPFSTSGSYRFLPSAVDSAYAIVPISGDVDPSIGTYTYTKTSATTATLSVVDVVAGGLNVACTFNTANSGTYIITSTAYPGRSQSGTFVLYAGASPQAIAGTTVTVTITSGAVPFASMGSFRFLPATSGNTYNTVALSGNVANSSGTYAYNKNSDYTGIITFDDSVGGLGQTFQLSFDTPTSGTLLLRKLGSTGYQTGIFSMTTPSVPPTIITHPVSQTVILGASASFSVSASGTHPLAYQWRKNSVNINGANATSYTIASAQASDQGGYDVVVSNLAGSVPSSVATLVVLIPPSISMQPSGLTVFVGASATFSVTAAGSTPLSYQWRKNSIDIAGAKLASYTIGKVQSSDAGSYSVRVSNAAGSTNSNPATLVVNLMAPPAPVFSTPKWSQSGGWGAPKGFSAMLQAQPQAAYRIQFSTNLVNWFDLTNFVATGTSMPVSDPGSSAARTRFYRAVSP